MQNSEIRKKSERTCLTKYGVKFSLQDEKTKEKSKKTCLERYGVENPSQSLEIRRKKEATSLKRFGRKYHWIKEKHEKGDRAEYNKRYKGGFTGSLKKKIKERDEEKCQNPKCLKTNNRLLVHHIDNIKSNNSPENLITLCFSCHSKVTNSKNKKEQDYIECFTNIISQKYT